MTLVALFYNCFLAAKHYRDEWDMRTVIAVNNLHINGHMNYYTTDIFTYIVIRMNMDKNLADT